VVVESVPADEGFWLGSAQQRVFVHLTNRTESRFEIDAGRRVTFSGTVVSHGSAFARRVGVTGREGADELRARPVHIQVRQDAVSLQ
jgi:hypothetical protein